MNSCTLGHKTHDIIKVPTKIGDMYVFDVEKYSGNGGEYCPAQDAVSENLRIEGQWEPHDTKIIRGIMANGDRSSMVFDFGSHIGWYAIQAAKFGYTVHCFDVDRENIRLLKLNAELHNVTDRITVHEVWIDENFKMPKDICSRCDVELVKADIEGNERFVIKALEQQLENHLIKNLYLEITPDFNDFYPEMIKKIENYGYDSYWLGEKFNGTIEYGQINLEFRLK